MNAPRHSNGRTDGDERMKEQEIIAEAQKAEIKSRASPPGEVVYGAVFLEGQHELERRSGALAWSGLAAGLSMGFSFLAEAFLRSHLPNRIWTQTISKMGYAIGFLIVILGRQQLFTKNTLTVILPLLNRNTHTRLGNVARLWAIVLVSNLVGAFLFSWLVASTSMFDDDVRAAFAAIGRETFQRPFVSTFLRAILAGWLIALMIWLLPFAESARVWVITLLSYVIGLGHLPHIIAGSIPAFYNVLTGGVTVARWAGQFLAPVLLGNILGGVTLVAAAVHAEFQSEESTSRSHS